MNFSEWQGATKCTTGAAPGAKALLVWVLGEFESASNGGIYNCRDVRGGNTTSVHGEGRAIDVMFPVKGGKAHADGLRLVKLLGKYGKSLGIQALIFDRKIYSAKSPNGRPYTGVNPHVDHVHIELTRASGSKLTLATIRKYLEAPKVAEKPAQAPSRPIPKPVQELGDKVNALQFRSLKWHDKGDDVALVQRFLGIEDDGFFGKQTFAAVNRYKRERGLPVDGVWGSECWKLLRAVVKGV
jgi:peptidoglycan hydrolase-like protein with peptidoglycan-binding domain